MSLLPRDARPKMPCSLPNAALMAPICMVEVISHERPVASLPALSSNPTMSMLAISELPPWLMKGKVMPVSGMRPVTPPTMMKACKVIDAVRPAAVKAATSLLARAAVAKPRTAKSTYKIKTPPAPRRPISSAMALKMKSLSTMGMLVHMPRPIPTPNSPPSARE